ncbi:MAG: hypothetical protein WD851_02535 [Pirellulales bacterium]
MSRPRAIHNPFYILLAIVGVVFVFTAVAYGIMAFQMANLPLDGAPDHRAHPLTTWVRQYGDLAILVEIAALAVLTCAAIGTDSYWQRRAERS